MRRMLAIATILILAQSAMAATNWVAMAFDTNSAAFKPAGMNIVTNGATFNAANATNVTCDLPSFGIWGLTASGNLTVVSQIVTPRAGWWRVPNGTHVIEATAPVYDMWWQTNGVGNLVVRAF